jgi:hypothetical protein
MNTKNVFGLQLSAPKVGGQMHFFVLGYSSRALKHVEHKCFCLNLFWNSWAWSSRASKKAEQNFLASAKLLESYKKRNVNTKTKTKETQNKQLEREKTQKHEFGKTLKLISSCCFVCVSPTSYKNKNTMNIYVKISSKKLRFSNTHFSKNQSWKRDFKHNFIFSSLKKHHFIHTCYRAEWSQLTSTQLVMGTFNVHHRTNCASFGPLKQMINGFFY